MFAGKKYYSMKYSIKKELTNIYIKLRRFLPDAFAERLRRASIVSKLVKIFQPLEGNQQIKYIRPPLDGYRMEVPKSCVYSMAWGTYEPEVCEAINRIVKPGWLAVDIGAYVGYHTLLLTRKVGESGRVISFEPHPEFVSLLRHNIEMNNCERLTTVEPIAISEKTSLEKLVRIDRDSQATLQHTMAVGECESDFIIVPCCSLDDFFFTLSWPKVSFIKIDIEGSESRAIEGMKELIKRDRPIFIIESHGEKARDGFTYLGREGYRIHKMGHSGTVDVAELDKHEIRNEHWLFIP